MPKETFYGPTGTEPALTITWWGGGVNSEFIEQDEPVLINGVSYDRSGLNRLIRTFRRARDQAYGSDE
ncbi:hypothetical protein [Curtobacterium sp. Arg-1]|uniref:hypothetical protein n=1 Tax=Curtobacterium sp. Arg-1 TaxID=2935040 RepID=UPI0021DA5F20|nr:hypothetical protein [Curtobacterium sp. Arg-1]UXZ57075.1 hypothetical protein MXD64_13855 [Curtobacterium sp. Arg-1]